MTVLSRVDNDENEVSLRLISILQIKSVGSLSRISTESLFLKIGITLPTLKKGALPFISAIHCQNFEFY